MKRKIKKADTNVPAHNISQTSLFAAVSQLTDSNCLPARYEGAALPGELSWQNIKLWINLGVELIFGQRSVLNP